MAGPAHQRAPEEFTEMGSKEAQPITLSHQGNQALSAEHKTSVYPAGDIAPKIAPHIIEEDLLYNLAHQCESHFDKLLEILQKTKQRAAIEICTEFQQRFAIWTAYLGVFARKSQCLDTRLRNLPDLQDLVARLLDILRHSFLQIIAEIENPRETEMALSSDKKGATEISSQIQKAALETIDDTLTRLNRLGTTIRQSSGSRLDSRVKKFAAGQNMDPFAYLCAKAVQALYPGAHQSLKEYLSKSMTARYANMLYINSRRANLGARRGNLPRFEEILPTIEEIPSEKTQTNPPINPPANKVMSPAMSPLRIEPYAPSVSDLSSVDIRQIIIGSRQQVEVSAKHHKTSSIQIKLGYYPQMPNTQTGHNVFPCQWCGESLDKKQLSETSWRQHVDRDLKPYICLSEECPDAHPGFTTFNEWYKHMESHGWRWYQKVYLTSSWMCPLCEPSDNAYNNPQALYSHLTEYHSENLKGEQLEAISRQSKIEQSRAWNDCLLCCSTIEERKDGDWSVVLKRQKDQQKQEAIKSSRKNIEMTSPDHPSSDLDSWDSFSDSDDADSHRRSKQRGEDRSNVIARHIAQHLHMLVGLTIRFEALQNDGDGLDEDFKSNSADIDDEHSAVSDDTRYLGDSTMQDIYDEKSKESLTDLDVDIMKHDAFKTNWEHALKQLEGPGAKIDTDATNVTLWLPELDDPIQAQYPRTIAEERGLTRWKNGTYFRAIEIRDIPRIRKLLEVGADLETTDELGRTPLWHAVIIGHRSIIQLLLDHGANMNAQNVEAQDILGWAVISNRYDIIEILQPEREDKREFYSAPPRRTKFDYDSESS